MSNCVLTIRKGDETITKGLERLHSAPLHYEPVFDVWMALDGVHAYGDAQAWVVVAPRQWAASEIIAALGAAKAQPTSSWAAPTTDLITRFQWYADALNGTPADALVAALGPDEEAWGVARKPGQLAWELGTIPNGTRSAPPRLVVYVDKGLITSARVALARNILALKPN